MNQNGMVPLFCILVLLAGPSLAQLGTVERQGKQQDQQFLKAIAIADMTEAHLGEMAQSKAAQTAVKDLGREIAKDETEEYEQLTVLASKVGESIPKGIDAGKYPAVRKLTTRKDGDFDRDFLRDEIADERKVISALQLEAAHGANPDIKAWAGQTVGVRKQELQKAQAISK